MASSRFTARRPRSVVPVLSPLFSECQGRVLRLAAVSNGEQDIAVAGVLEPAPAGDVAAFQLALHVGDGNGETAGVEVALVGGDGLVAGEPADLVGVPPFRGTRDHHGAHGLSRPLLAR